LADHIAAVDFERTWWISTTILFVAATPAQR